VPGGVYIDTFVLRVAVPGQELNLPELPMAEGEAAPADHRQAFFDGWVETPVYELEALKPGHSLLGPAIVQAAYTTAVIPPGHRFHVDKHGLGILDREY
jgi:N-methylhydantoinase A/oxoprolinase/acetone carboxylase beta subunit